MNEQRQRSDTLAPGTDVDAYVIKSVLGAGGFGVTYRAEHRRLGKDFAIKEYYPRAFAVRDGTHVIARTKAEGTYQWGLDRFLQEARALARFHHPAIVQVSNVFEANGTAYMVLSFEDGRDMRGWLDELGRAPTQAELDAIAAPMLDALSHLHADGLLHRDIAPDNIYIRRNGTPVLLDFGAARDALSQQSQQMSAIVKTGYSPPEQYHTKAASQGPWSDIYAFGATLYWAVSGRLPPESIGRLEHDDYVSAAKVARGAFRPEFLGGIDAALRVSREERPQTIAAWQQRLLGGAAAAERPRVIPHVATPAPQPPPAPEYRQPAAANPDPTTASEPKAAATLIESPAPPVDLGPGKSRERTMGRLTRLVAMLIGVIALVSGLFQILGIDRFRALVGNAVGACDSMAAMPGDHLAKALAVEYERLDLSAISICQSALAKAGSHDKPRITAQLSMLMQAAGDMAAAHRLAQESSAAGYSAGMVQLGEMLTAGLAPASFDMKQACRLFERAATAGSPTGMDSYAGSCLATGLGGVKQDAARAAEMYRAAAERGLRSSMVNFAVALRDGEGVARNPAEAQRWLEKSIAAASPYGMVVLGYMLESGEGLAKDERRAQDLFRRAVPLLARMTELKSGSAASWLGDLHRDGSGVTKNEKEAARLYRLASELGMFSGMTDLAELLLDGRGVAKNEAEALRWLRLAAERGSPVAMNRLGVLTEDGVGITADFKEAANWYKRAADLNNAAAQNNLGKLHENGNGVRQDRAEALRLYKLSAGRGYTSAMVNLGQLAEAASKPDYAEAMRWYRRAADKGDGEAMFYVGVLFENGRGVPKNHVEANAWYQRGVDAGDARSMNNLAMAYSKGTGAKKDLAAALALLLRAAALGNAYAMSNLGVHYKEGDGVKQDMPEAFRWFQKGAELGNDVAMLELAVMYMKGQGVAKSCIEALAWFKKSAEAGQERAKGFLQDLKGKSSC